MFVRHRSGRLPPGPERVRCRTTTRKEATMNSMTMSLRVAALLIALAAPCLADERSDQVLDLSFEDLLNSTVTSAAKRSQPLSDAATALFVVRGEDIRRSGAVTIADALRLVPGLQVGQIDAGKWAVTARGFNGRFSNKLLVLVDGRSVYTTSFSGVYWEIQDVMLEDIDRIEVIRGPGGTLWGANAVNGVINIITKNAADTQGGVATATAGDARRFFGGVRQGTRLGSNWFARGFAKVRSHGQFVRADGRDAGDDWRTYQAGFRADSHLEGSDRFTVEGNVYHGEFHQEVVLPLMEPPYTSLNPDKAVAKGGNVLARWQRTLSPTSELSLQAYYDQTDRLEIFEHEISKQADIEFQHHFTQGLQTIVWGTGYRFTRDSVAGLSFFEVAQPMRDYNLLCAFAQDELSLADGRFTVTGGAKFEHNDYTGGEWQPSLRAIWKVADRHRLWSAASRAVRTPMRAEDEFHVTYSVIPPGSPMNPGPLPVALVVTGDENFASEVLRAYEAGYRFATPEFSTDLSLFVQDYENLRMTSRGMPIVHASYIEQPVVFGNGGSARTWGGELALGLRPIEASRLNLAYSFLDTEFDSEGMWASEATAPRHQVSLSSSTQIRRDVQLDLWLRYLDKAQAMSAMAMRGQPISAFTTLDARLAWQLHENLEFSVTGQNLLEDQHQEYIAESFVLPAELPRTVSATATWEF
jgi:iron complex outermembrane recepter protein